MIDGVLGGKIRLEDQPVAIQSACRLEIYNEACRVLEFRTKADRQEEIEKIPELIRPHIKNEIMRVWRMRNGES